MAIQHIIRTEDNTLFFTKDCVHASKALPSRPRAHKKTAISTTGFEDSIKNCDAAQHASRDQIQTTAGKRVFFFCMSSFSDAKEQFNEVSQFPEIHWKSHVHFHSQQHLSLVSETLAACRPPVLAQHDPREAETRILGGPRP